jgi:hypothetical protein
MADHHPFLCLLWNNFFLSNIPLFSPPSEKLYLHHFAFLSPEQGNSSCTAQVSDAQRPSSQRVDIATAPDLF